MEEVIPVYEKDNKREYLNILKALNEIPFSVGKNLLIDFLIGSEKNKSIIKNRLYELRHFDSLNKNKSEILEIIDNLITNKLIEITNAEANRFFKLLKLTSKGRQEILNPQLYKKKINHKFNHKETEITEQDKIIFKELNPFLEKYNDNQKKAIISNNPNILCIAGAGSGKTTVLTKRIEFLVKYRNIDPKKILAITFTRKAREEMQERLFRLDVNTTIETFNSFSEKILQKHGNKIYSTPTRVMNYGNKIMAMMSALSSINLSLTQALDIYFSPSQKNSKTQEQLSNIFMNDCFFILDYFKEKDIELYDFSQDTEKNKETARMIYRICKDLQKQMFNQGLRSYTDQILDTIKLLTNNPELTPEYDYILVDEYQDVNSSQINLIELLKTKNLFAVGDPRQSIFGWRGSDISYILNFQEKYPNSEIISLNKNYRSNSHIVNLMNSSIKSMQLPDLTSSFNNQKQIQLLDFNSEGEEYNFVINKILSSPIKRKEMFVLARTNRQLNELANLMKQKQIKYILKTDEFNGSLTAKDEQVTLATIHSIKGLEAKKVFVIGCKESNFPCKSSDHPIIELIKIEEYDKEEEEKRLFYVAISRAKEILYLSYTGKKPTYFINSDMIKIIEEDE
ncbi:UvrD-helicase domain-containing protein [archaeon]|jgi:superfamily I DNA/RNA helicase|nr:UvrD-helicase domain-containing protein [archaeon]MBT4241317.1 UvrD-helicase domain-containing protein [archaeon]MBT4418138.1 UvrD-helicase domain-containing protein [archaeon]